MPIRHVEIPAGPGGEKDVNDYRDQPEVVHEAAEPSFRLVRAGELKATPPVWLVRDVLEADTLALIFGDPAAGKSFVAVDLLASIATGTDFHGHAVKQGPAIMINGEGQNGLARRLKAWAIRHQSLDDAPLFVSQRPASLCEAESVVAVVSAVDHIAKDHGPPVLVAIDTLARNFGPGDENSTKDMSQFIQAADMIRAAHGSTVLLIHHTGHADKTRARGAMALRGALDAEYRMDRDETGVIRLEATKMKDAALPDPLAFHLRTVELDLIDEDGQPVTSAVLDVTDYEPPKPAPAAGKGKWQTEALKALQTLTERQRGNLESAGFDPDTVRVSLEDWRGECKKAGMSKQRFHEVKSSLTGNGLVSIVRGYVSGSGSG